ncbi:MAG: glycine cleavage system protein GcvH [Flavobacteriales bacterium AspAUS03]
MSHNFRYSKDHEWLKISGDIAYIGITDFAQGELGDVVYVEVDTVGQTLDQGEVFGVIEAVKTVSDLFMPASGKIIAFNTGLETTPELVNTSPYDKGWIIQIEISQPGEYEILMSFDEYKTHIGRGQQER